MAEKIEILLSRFAVIHIRQKRKFRSHRKRP